MSWLRIKLITTNSIAVKAESAAGLVQAFSTVARIANAGGAVNKRAGKNPCFASRPILNNIRGPGMIYLRHSTVFSTARPTSAQVRNSTEPPDLARAAAGRRVPRLRARPGPREEDGRLSSHSRQSRSRTLARTANFRIAAMAANLRFFPFPTSRPKCAASSARHRAASMASM